MISVYFVAIAAATAAIGQTSNVTYEGTITTGLAYPARLAPAPDGGVYVTDPPSKKVLYYDPTGLLPPIAYTVADGPVGIAINGDGSRVFLSRSDGKIGVYNAGFVFQSLVNPAPLVLAGPNDLAFDPDANWQCTEAGVPLACCSGPGAGTCAELYAVDAGGHQVLVFRETSPGSWTLVRAWGMEGAALGEFESPQAIALDEALHHVIVTDVDNFRMQVFDATGTLLFKFGYRILYTTVTNNSCVRAGYPWACCTGWRTGTCGTATETAWFARSEGVAVDECSNIYISDALMGTVRVFDSTGVELDAAHQPVIGYGSGPDSLRVPCDLMINAGKLYVADTNDGAIEVYDVACESAAAAAASAGPALEDAIPRSAKGQREVNRLDGSHPLRAGIRQMPDNPAEIVSAMNTGEFRDDLDMNRDRVVNMDDLEIAVARFGAATVEDFLNVTTADSQVAAHDAVVPPHILDISNRCGRCHSMDGAPGGMLTAMGQENLCQSCHSSGKIAGHDWIGPGDRDMNHPWGVPASDADPGPAPGSEVALHLDAGNVRCGTCHNPHESSQGTCDTPSPITGWEFPSHIGSCTGGSANGQPCQSDSQCEMTFMRTEGKKINLCGECHVQFDEWLHAGHAEELADPWSHYDWSMGNNWLCTGPGTPYAYCTGEGVGTAASAAAAACTAAGVPLACCTAPGTGPTCTVSNAGCSGLRTPWGCCTGPGTGNCANNLSAAACTGLGTPMACCTGQGTGSCSSRESCRQCHSGNGYIDFSGDFPDGVVQGSRHRGTFRVIDCLVCHTTHGKSHDEHLLRIYDTVRLPTGQVISDLGSGATCVSCHNGRATPPLPNPAGVSTPHYLNGGAMLEGINAVNRFPYGGPNSLCTAATAPFACCTGAGTGTCPGPDSACTGAGVPWACCTGAGTGTCPTVYTLTNSNHTSNADLNCTTCHMAPVPTTGPEAGKIGGHTFNMMVHDPDDPAYGVENVDNACNSVACHGGAPLASYDRIVPSPPYPANRDYDGDGTIEGVQTETLGLLNLLKDALYAAGASRLLVNETTGLPTTEPEICTAAGVPLACCTGVRTGPGCLDPDAHGENPYWTTSRCAAGTRAGLPCRGSGVGTAPFDCPGSTCTAMVPTGDRTATLEDAIWNWEFVDNSGDRGVKNTGYAIGLLQIAYKGVTGVPVPDAGYRYTPAP